jgi:hypothetical protein
MINRLYHCDEKFAHRFYIIKRVISIFAENQYDCKTNFADCIFIEVNFDRKSIRVEKIISV